MERIYLMDSSGWEAVQSIWKGKAKLGRGSDKLSVQSSGPRRFVTASSATCERQHLPHIVGTRSDTTLAKASRD